MKTRSLSAFAGVNTSFNARDLPDNAASGMLNAIVEDGEVSPRHGYKNLALAQSSFSALYGFDYVQGYDSSTEKEVYLSVETISGDTRAYLRNVSTLAPTVLTNGGAGVTLHASEWVFLAFREYAYLINPNNTSAPVYRHAIGTANSLLPMAVPSDPTTKLTYVVKYGGGSNPYSKLVFTGINVATNIVYSGAAHSTNSAVQSDGGLWIGHNNDDEASYVEIDISAASGGIQDWADNDKFAFTALVPNKMRLASGFTVTLINNDGSPVELTPDKIENVTSAISTSTQYQVRFGFSNKDRTLFDNIKKIRISYTVVASDGDLDNIIQFSPIWIGGVDMTQVRRGGIPGTEGLYLAYTYYFSTPGWESGLSPSLFIPNSVLQGYDPLGGGTDPTGKRSLGVHIEVTATVSGDANVDNIRYYAVDNVGGAWHRLATQTDADLTYEVKLTYAEILALDEFSPSPFNFTGIIAAFEHKGSVVWLYDDGDENIRYARIGEPVKQATEFDSEEDLNRGATFTMADNFGDKPLGGVSVGDATMFAARYGVHYQLGDYPSQMTFPRKTAGSFGVAGKRAFCRYKDDNGVAGMAYVSPNGQAYFAIPGSGSDDGNNVSLTESIRDGDFCLRTWLLDGQANLGFTDFSSVQIKVDDRDDSLVIIMGKRGLRLRRPDQTGNRSWHPEEYNTGGNTVSIKYLASSPKWGLRWMRSDGKADESEFNNADRVYIGGVNRDGGNPMPAGYWRSKVFTGQNRRIKRVYLNRNPIHVDGAVKVLSLRLKQLYRIVAGKLFVNCAPLQQGFDHQFEIRISEATGRITELRWEEETLGGRTNL